MKPKTPQPEPGSGGLLGVAGYVFLVYMFLGYPYIAFRLSRSGQATVATVTSCEFFMKTSRGRSRPRWRWEIEYDGHVVHTEYTWPVEPGQQIPVLYLPDDPSVVEIGLPGDSTWAIMFKNIRGYAVVNVVVGLVIIVAPLVLFGVGVVEHNRKKRAGGDKTPRAVGGEHE